MRDKDVSPNFEKGVKGVTLMFLLATLSSDISFERFTYQKNNNETLGTGVYDTPGQNGGL